MNMRSVPSGITLGRELGRKQTLDCDVVIVGSGAGGAVVAHELAEAGQRVIVLEEGPYIAPETYQAWRPSESMRHIWRDGGMTVAFPWGDGPAINVTMGRVVGGSSVLTGGVCFRTPDHVLDEWVRDRHLPDLSPHHMEPFFDEVERDVHVVTVPDAMRSRGVRRFGQGLDTGYGHQLKPIRRNTIDCEGYGQCNFGCPKGAKQSVDVAYLPKALRNGAQVISDCLVERVLMKGGRAVGVKGHLLRDHRRARGPSIEVRAKRVVVACGSWHSPLLLRRSGIGRRNRNVGRHMTLHPAFKMLARFDEPIEGWKGALQSAYTDAFEDEGLTIMSLFIPTGVLAATMPGFGATLARRAADIPNLAIMGGIIHDEGGGVVRRGPGREPLVTYRMHPRDRASIPTIVRRMADIFFEGGAKEVFLPVLGAEPQTADSLKKFPLEKLPGRQFECTSQHPLGSCRMGPSAKSSVTDDHGRVWGTEGLYVADGSIVPTSLGVNPQVTIMAMALRVARKIRG